MSGIGSEKGTSADDAATDEKKSVTIDSQSCVGLGRRQARGMAALSAAALQKVVAALQRKFAHSAAQTAVGAGELTTATCTASLPLQKAHQQPRAKRHAATAHLRAMSYLLPHLNSGWAVDQAILAEEARVVVVRFGHDYDPQCMVMDEVLYSIAELVKNYAVIYLVDTTEVPDFNTMYELYDPCTTMFFFRNKHIMIDLGTGNNNKINWAIHDKQEVVDIIETVYRGARKGRGLVVSPKDYSTKYRY